MREFVLNANVIEIMMAGLIFFAVIYFCFGAVNWLVTKKILPAFNIGLVLDPRPLIPGQLRHELLWSLSSIAIFGFGMVFPWGVLKLGWAHLAVNPPLWQTLIEVLVLLIWNDIHFYANHRLLHTPKLRRFHSPHHRSVVTTPWSTYSFHPVEAMMLGNVILWPMLVHDFSVYALLSLPIFSLIFNNVGHSNYHWSKSGRTILHNASRRHHIHHACFNGNFGFMFPFMDKAFNTALPMDAAEHTIQQSMNKRRERQQ